MHWAGLDVLAGTMSRGRALVDRERALIFHATKAGSWLSTTTFASDIWIQKQSEKHGNAIVDICREADKRTIVALQALQISDKNS